MSDPQPAGVSRRRLFGWVGAGTAGVLAAGATGGAIGRATAEGAPS
jgi:deferrochelatase/peroxidase EfeB